MEFIGTGKKLSDDDINALANSWGVEPATIHAVDEVESNGSGFLPDKRPKILFEAHVFWRLTSGMYGKNNISWPVWNKSLYGGAGVHQYDRLHQAVQLNRPAALQSASWGRYQVLGNNYKDLGYESPELFVNEMTKGEAEQLEAFARFCEKNNLVGFLQAKNWERFVRRYNGPGQVEYYVGKLIKVYEKWKDKEVELPTPPPNESNIDESNNDVSFKLLRFGMKGKEIELLQEKLGGVEMDGVFGGETLRRVKEFQTESELKVDGIVGKITWNKLSERN